MLKKCAGALLQCRIAVASDEGGRFIESQLIKVCEGMVEVVEGTAKEADVVGPTEVGSQGSLRGLVFEVATEVSPTEATT